MAEKVDTTRRWPSRRRNCTPGQRAAGRRRWPSPPGQPGGDKYGEVGGDHRQSGVSPASPGVKGGVGVDSPVDLGSRRGAPPRQAGSQARPPPARPAAAAAAGGGFPAAVEFDQAAVHHDVFDRRHGDALVSRRRAKSRRRRPCRTRSPPSMWTLPRPSRTGSAFAAKVWKWYGCVGQSAGRGANNRADRPPPVRFVRRRAGGCRR